MLTGLPSAPLLKGACRLSKQGPQCLPTMSACRRQLRVCSMPGQPPDAARTAGRTDQAFRPPIQLRLAFSRGLMGHTGGCFSGEA